MTTGVDGSNLVSVTSSEHASKLAGGLWNFRSSSHGVDMDIRWSGGEKFARAHRLVLEVFLSPEKLCQWVMMGQPEVTGDGHEPEIDESGPQKPDECSLIDCLLEFLYKGAVNVREGDLQALLDVANSCDFMLLSDAIEMARNAAEAVRKGRRRRKGIPVKISPAQAPKRGRVATKQVPKPKAGTIERPPARKRQKRAVTKAINKETESDPASDDSDYRPDDRALPEEVKPNNSGTIENKKVEEDVADKSRASVRRPPVAKGVRRKPGSGSRRKQGSGSRRKPVVEHRSKEEVAMTKAEYYRLWNTRQPLLKCDRCDYQTKFKKSFRLHQAKHDPTAFYLQRCETCSRAFFDEAALERHRKTHAGDPAIHECQHCDYRTERERHLNAHMVSEHQLTPKGGPLLRCTECDFSCAYDCHMKFHVLQRHSNEKPFPCPECDYASVRKHDIVKHVRMVHKKVRPYMCETCGHKTLTAHTLMRHQRVHTGEQPYSCATCGKPYAHKDKLKLHERRHAGEDKPYLCQICTFSCQRLDNLKCHIKRVHKTLDALATYKAA